jgi:glycosyltransferase involved in cell wall biosynthesis
MNACRRYGVPLLVHFHGFDASRTKLLDEVRPNYEKMFRQAAGVIAVSHQMEDKLLELGVPREKLHYNPYGVDCQNAEFVEAGANPPVVVTVGRLTAKKAPHLTILAFAQVLARHPSARLRMIGDGPLLGVCRDLVKSLHIQEAVTLLGAQPPQVVFEELQSARCFAQHSVEAEDGDREGTPVSILEAGACGLPVVATRHAGIPDVVQHAKTGLLVDEWDVDGMAANLAQLLTDPGLATRLGSSARERVAGNFSMERHIDRLWSIVLSCLQSHASSQSGHSRSDAA